MTLRHMKIFLSLCEHQYNTTRAAEVEHMTQPAVSLAIKELEQYYGVRLFERMGRKLKITPIGERFEAYARRICGLFDDMEREIRDWDSFGILRVGASITIGSQFLPGYVREFRRRYPGTKVRVTVAPTERIEAGILENRLDFGLVEGVTHDPAIQAEEYMDDHLVAICPGEGSFAPGETVPLEVFKRQDFLLREPGSGTREVFDQAVAGAGFSVTPIWEATSTAALVNGVINGLGIAVLPSRMVRLAIDRGLVHAIRPEGLDFRRKFRVICHRDKFLTRSARNFLEICRQDREENGGPEQENWGDLPGRYF